VATLKNQRVFSHLETWDAIKNDPTKSVGEWDDFWQLYCEMTYLWRSLCCLKNPVGDKLICTYIYTQSLKVRVQLFEHIPESSMVAVPDCYFDHFQYSTSVPFS